MTPITPLMPLTPMGFGVSVPSLVLTLHIRVENALQPNILVVGGTITTEDEGNGWWSIKSRDEITQVSFNSSPDFSSVTKVECLIGKYITSMNQMFYNGNTYPNDVLESIFFGDAWDMTKLTSLSSCFDGLSGLICINRLDSRGAETARTGIFWGCTSLVQPNATAQAALMAADGINWVNANPCPSDTLPSIELIGSNPQTITINSYEEQGATATDAEDGDLIVDIDLTQLDETQIGTGKVFYSVTDSDGNTTVVARDIVIEANATVYPPSYKLTEDLIFYGGFNWIVNSALLPPTNPKYNAKIMYIADSTPYIVPTNHYTKGGFIYLPETVHADTEFIYPTDYIGWIIFSYDVEIDENFATTGNFKVGAFYTYGDGTADTYLGDQSTPMAISESGKVWNPPVESWKISNDAPDGLLPNTVETYTVITALSAGTPTPAMPNGIFINNITAYNDLTTVYALDDTNSVDRGVTIQVIDGANATSAGGMDTSDNSGVASDFELSEYFYVSDTGIPTMAFDINAPNGEYTISIVPSRNTTSVNRVGLYTLGSHGTQSVDAAGTGGGNTTLKAEWTNVTINNETITLSVAIAVGSSYAYANTIIIERTA